MDTVKRLLHKDILIKPKAMNEISKSPIHLILADEQKEGVNFFEVLEVSSRVTEVKKGDIVLVRYGEHMIPFLLNGEMVSITDEEKVMGVLENV